jgi:hypothetical protein
MRSARYCFGACVVAGEIYVTGGKDDGNNFLSSVEKYTPSSDTWSAVAPLPAGRSHHALVAVGSAMYVLGGFDGEDDLSSVLKFDSTQSTWSVVAPMPEAKTGFATCAVGNDIYVFGGNDMDNEPLYSATKFDTEANEWSNLADMPHGGWGSSASLLGGSIYLVGAGDSGCEVLRFDPVPGRWCVLAPTSISRNFGASLVEVGCLFAAGGQGHRASVERYDIYSNTWTAAASMLEGRSFFNAVTIESTGPAEQQGLFDSLIAKANRRLNKK